MSPPVTRRLTPPIISVSSSPCVHRDTVLKRLAAVSQREQGATEEDIEELSWHSAGKRAKEAPMTFPACQEGVNPNGGGQTLDSMVTECLINAAMCPVPRTSATSGPFLRVWKRGRGQQEERGASGPPLCHCICPERGWSPCRGLRQMTLVSHEVMGDSRLVSNDGCVEGETIS